MTAPDQIHWPTNATGAPSIAVVIPCWNAENWIARAIQSVLNQNYPNLEVIVIDDGSTDGSLEIVKLFRERVRWESGPNRGACVARNRGLELASAEYVMFLDADDFIQPGSLQAWVGRGDETGGDAIFGRWRSMIDGKLTPESALDETKTSGEIARQWLEGRYTPPCAIVWRRSHLKSIGGWNIAALRNQDGELAIRAILSGANVAIANSGMGVYVQHDTVGRVSKRDGKEVLNNELELFRHLLQLASAKGRTDLRSSFSRAFYGLARRAFTTGLDDIGHEALGEARALGLRGHVGTRIHCMTATLLGLRAKTRLVTTLANALPRRTRRPHDGRSREKKPSGST